MWTVDGNVLDPLVAAAAGVLFCLDIHMMLNDKASDQTTLFEHLDTFGHLQSGFRNQELAASGGGGSLKTLDLSGSRPPSVEPSVSGCFRNPTAQILPLQQQPLEQRCQQLHQQQQQQQRLHPTSHLQAAVNLPVPFAPGNATIVQPLAPGNHQMPHRIPLMPQGGGLAPRGGDVAPARQNSLMSTHGRPIPAIVAGPMAPAAIPMIVPHPVAHQMLMAGPIQMAMAGPHQMMMFNRFQNHCRQQQQPSAHGLSGPGVRPNHMPQHDAANPIIAGPTATLPLGVSFVADATAPIPLGVSNSESSVKRTCLKIISILMGEWCYPF